ncbi:MAG: transposase, partial [Alphaproteobacteria bacterium]|nr:transposase [Alphaproteobacteria bacterium]
CHGRAFLRTQHPAHGIARSARRRAFWPPTRWHVVGTDARVPAVEYAPRDPSASALYAVVGEHVESFLAEAARMRDGQSLPRFVEDEFRGFLRCGFLAGGFARFRCTGCTTERLVAFSCKGRGFCPSCGGRRMAERAAHLVDHVLPDVPVRQWVLTLPYRLRYVLAWRHDLCRRVARILHGAIERHLRTWAQAHGVAHPRGGGVAVLQRFGGSVNLNVHVHALLLDGVFARAAGGGLRFHAAPAPSSTDVAEVLATIVPRVRALLTRHDLDEDDASDPGDASPVLADWAATSVEGLVGAGAARRRPTRLGAAAIATSHAQAPCHAQWEGFDLHAGVRVPAGQRDRLERVCRYALRPPLAEERITTTPDGDVAVHLRRPWGDGTTHLVFEPKAFLARLAVLVPRPRVNLVLYHGVLAPRAAWRREVVATEAPQATGVPPADQSAAEPACTASLHRGWRWADLMRRVFAVDVLACPRCGGRLRLIATLDASGVTRRILGHLGFSTEVPLPKAPRAPPGLDDWAS